MFNIELRNKLESTIKNGRAATNEEMSDIIKQYREVVKENPDKEDNIALYKMMSEFINYNVEELQEIVKEKLQEIEKVRLKAFDTIQDKKYTELNTYADKIALEWLSKSYNRPQELVGLVQLAKNDRSHAIAFLKIPNEVRKQFDNEIPEIIKASKSEKELMFDNKKEEQLDKALYEYNLMETQAFLMRTVKKQFDKNNVNNHYFNSTNVIQEWAFWIK